MTHGRFQSRLAVLAVAVALAAAACGASDSDSDDGGSVSSSGSATGSVSATGAQEAACRPVGRELAAAATEKVEVELQDFAFSPSTLAVDAGVVSFAVTNAGSENHELAFLPGAGEVPLNAEGEPDEDALAEAGAFELEAFGPGQNCDATYDLKPGTYTMFCIVASTDGETHYDKGMQGRLTVE